MKVTLKFFASLREALGAGGPLEVPEGATIADVRRLLRARDTAHAEALAEGRALRCALNQTLSPETAVVTDGAELAFFPPVTGG
ncbi:MAG: MoaD/ThiS family protein [Rhizobacter sp.]